MPDPSGEHLIHLATQFELAVAAGVDPNVALANLNIYPNLAALKTAKIASVAPEVMVLCYANPGDCAPVTYASGGTAGRPGVVVDGLGNPWTLVSGADGNSAKAFGQTALARTNTASWVTAGPDDTAAIQAAIDFEVYGHGAAPILGQGVSFISEGLQVGYGDTFTTGHLKGQGIEFVTNNAFAGSGIGFNFSDRPAINVQGGRLCSLEGFSLQGALTAYVLSNNFCLPGALLDDTNPANWCPANLAPNQDSVTAPYAGVCVDGRSGPPPSPAYANYAYPAWVKPQTQYNRAFTTGLKITDVFISGVTVGVVTQPSGTDGNGDYVKLDHVLFQQVKWCISIGQNQMRNLQADNIQAAQVYCVFTNGQHGQRQGQICSEVQSLSIGQAIMIFNLSASTAYSGPFNVRGYAEGLYKIGKIASGGTGDINAGLTDFNASFDLQTTARGIPAAMLDLSGHVGVAIGGPQTFTLSGGEFVGFYGVMSLLAPYVELQNGVGLISALNQNASLPAYQCLFVNGTAGGLQVPGWQAQGVPHRIKFPIRDLDLGTIYSSVVTKEDYAYAGRNYCLPLYVTSFTPRLAVDPNVALKNPQGTRITAIPVPAGASYNPATGVLTYALGGGYTRDYLETCGGAAGDAILEVTSNTVAMIKDVVYGGSGASVTAIGLTNLYTGAGACYEVAPFPTSGGVFSIVNTRLYSPAAVMTCTAASGSNTLTNVTNLATGNANELVQVGDRVWFDANNNPLGLTPASCKITGVNAAAGTITLAGNVATAGGATLTLLRLGLFIRQPPANA